MGIRVDQNILNQKGTPAFNASFYANRPAAGFLGRIFISTDTYEIYRDEGVGWSLIADAGSGAGTLSSVTFNGNSTPYGINIISGGLFLVGSTNGSIFFASGGNGQFTTDSTNFFWDDTNNRLGIGTAAPSARLDVHSSSGTSAILNGTGVSNALLTFQSAGVNKWSVGNFVSSTVADDFNIYDAVNTISRLQVHNTGVVNIPTSLIIGTTTPTSIYSLDVTGSGRFTSALLASSTITGSAFIPSGATVPTNGMYLSAANTLAFSTNSTNQLSIASTGLASFNYNTSGTALKITTSYASGRVANFGFGDGTVLPTAAFYIGNQTGVGVYIGDETSATKGLYVTSAGNVLIGETTDAGQKLQVTANSSVYSSYIVNNGSGSGLWVTSSGSAGTSNILRLRSTGVDRLLVTDLGKIQAISTIAGDVIMDLRNDSTTGYGAAIKGGSGTLYSFKVENYAGTIIYQINGNGNIYAPSLDSGTGTALVLTSGGFISKLTSSIRYKKDIEPIDIGLDFILSLNPVSYNLKNDNTPQVGFIAEDFPEDRLVSLSMIDTQDVTKGYQKESVNYAQIVAPLVKAIQELNEKLIRNNIN